MDNMEVQPHIRLSKKDVPPVVLTMGDPARVQKVAELCDKYFELAYNREYRSYSCEKDGVKFLAISHGVGSSGAAVCFEELIHCGAKVIIRAGTAGSLQKDCNQGDVVICQAAVRDEGYTRNLIPKIFPAVSDIDVLMKLKESALELSGCCKIGYTLTSDAFYKSKAVEESLYTYKDAGVSMVEMEISSLFVLGKIRNVKTGAICVIDGSPLGEHYKNYDPIGEKVTNGKIMMLKIAIHTCIKLAKSF